MVVVGDQSFMHDNIYVYAEGVLRAVISVKAGEFLQRVFTVSVTDGALDLTLVDAGGSDSNWVINALIVEQYTERKFDFGTDSSAVEAGYTQVLSTTLYSEDTGFGWVDTMGLYSRDRGVPDALRRDFVFSSSNRTFRVDVPNGKYMVQVIVGDNAFSHDNIYVYAEGALVVGNLTVEAGRFAEVVFYVEVWDGHLELTFIDGGGKDANWVVNCIYVKSAVTLNFEFDFGTNSSLVEAGFLRVAENTVYSPSIGYGWSAIANLQSRDRGAPDALRRDFVFSSGDGAFNLDVPNGKYQVTLIIGDMNYMHDKMDVYAEGTLMISDLNVSSGTFKEVTFTVSVNDCQLNMVFHDGGGVDSNWVINALSVEALV
jgi:fibronectin type 3 domain-containing protein